MTVPASAATSKTSYLLVHLHAGDEDGEDFYYTNNTEDVVEGGDTYAALPGMRVEGLMNTGGLDSKPITIDVKTDTDDAGFFAGLADGRACAPIYLFLREIIAAYGPSGTATQTIEHAIGDYRLQRVYKNPDRTAGLIRLEFAHHKARLKVPLGIVASPLCAWTLGDKSCQIDLGALVKSGVVLAIAGKILTLTPDGAGAIIAGSGAGYWHRGFIDLNGLRVGIRDWEAGSYDFAMVREPPAVWVGQTVYFFPGCDKTPATCIARFDNEEHFGGLGIAIPSYIPTQEIP